MLNLSVEIIEELKTKYEFPLYLFDENCFIDNYIQLAEAFRAFYPGYRVSYSYKTNYTPYICSLVKKLNGYAEVVSGMERYIARNVGYDSNHIIYNGPNKGTDGLEALVEGCIINVDSIDELNNICSAIIGKDGHYKIGLRVNLDIGQSFISRFGMDESDISKAFFIVSSIPNLEIVGLHCHISRCRGLEAWKKRTEVMLKLADKYFATKPPQYIDLGSGMFGQMDEELAKQFECVPTYKQYAEVTAGIVADHYKNIAKEDKPLLFTEPGTTLINKYIDFVGKVDGIKNIRGKYYAVLNCSEHNLGETCMLKKLPIKVFSNNPNNKIYRNLDIVGYTCLEQDVMYTNYTGKIGTGDYVQFGNVGGYSNVYKPPFIWPNCAMIAVNTLDNQYKLIKKAETFDDILHTYMFIERDS